MEYSNRIWVPLAILCGLILVSCEKEKSTTVIKEVPVKEEPGVEFKVDTDKDGGVDVEVKGKVESK